MEFNNYEKIQVRFNDIDGLGHVNNAVHLYYYDLGRLSYFREALKNDIRFDGEYLMVVRVAVDYLVPAYLDESLFVRTAVESIGTKSVKFVQEVVNQDTGEIKSRNHSVMVAMDARLDGSIEVPERWRKWIEDFEKQ